MILTFQRVFIVTCIYVDLSTILDIRYLNYVIYHIITLYKGRVIKIVKNNIFLIMKNSIILCV